MKCCEYGPWGHFHNISFSLLPTNGPNKLPLHYTWLESLATDKHSRLLGPFVSYKENKRCEYGQWCHDISSTAILSTTFTTCPNQLLTWPQPLHLVMPAPIFQPTILFAPLLEQFLLLDKMTSWSNDIYSIIKSQPNWSCAVLKNIVYSCNT